MDVFIVLKSKITVYSVPKHLFLPLYFAKNEKKKKNSNFWPNHGLTPLEKCDFLKSMLLSTRKVTFKKYNVTKHLFLAYILQQLKRRKHQKILYQNYGLTRLEKWKFCDFLNRCFYMV